MFHTFFPRPRLFFMSFAIWALFCVVVWFSTASGWGKQFSIGPILGYDYPAALTASEAASEPVPEPTIPESDKATGDSQAKAKPKAPPKPSAAQVAFSEQTESANDFWFYQYMLIAYAAFVIFWLMFSPHEWRRWSVIGSAVIVFATWFQVHLDVLINEWFGRFYDMIQEGLSGPNTITIQDYNGQLLTFIKIALVAVIVGSITRFFVSHYIFRWRTAMNNYYTSKWKQLRHIEGASQRIQEDTMRFASIMESLGVAMIDSVMTLIAFLPILWGLSAFVKVLPFVGEVPQALVFLAILWAAIGTSIIALAGIKLPGLEFRNQRVEAAYRKELVYGEDDEDRAQPPTLINLFGNVRRNYFRLYFHYFYFNVVRISYLQAGVLVPYFALGPTIVTAGFTLGVMQQIIRAFNRVETSFQFLVNSWSTIVELMSIYKRLQAFEATLNDRPLPTIDRDYLEQSPG